MLVEFNDLLTGTYAVIALHDENTNGEMDKNFIGRPKEGFGTSNNLTFFAPQRFSSAAFELIEDAKMTTEMVYF